MVAESFFSTVAKVVATIIGFGLAIFTVYFQISRQRRLDQTEEVVDLMGKFAGEYRDVLNRTKSLIASQSGPGLDASYKNEWVAEEPDKLRKRIRDDPDVQNPEATYVYALLHGIEHVCGEVANKQVTAGEIPNNQFFEKLPELIEALSDYFDPRSDEEVWYDFYKEMSGSTADPDSHSSSVYDEDILPESQSDYYLNSLAHWVKSQNERKKRPFDQFDISGLGMPSLLILTLAMKEDYQEINRKLRGSLVDYNPKEELGNIIHRPASALIVSVGLIVPVIMLTDSPTLSPILADFLPVALIIEVVQVTTVPILVVSFYYQFNYIYEEVIGVDNE